jgi:hypothetical protein
MPTDALEPKQNGRAECEDTLEAPTGQQWLASTDRHTCLARDAIKAQNALTSVSLRNRLSMVRY